ncbi:hypothetical protein PLAN_100551 [Planktothrix rubescens CCAP 1459/22]|uniref:Uncharacterized protein n=1 Tax=Planktothrix rubescens CCAP 1459/22 TaxID=329571 RepID=A0A6J7ZHP8_PLARU|nr:hypothetical protein PLAN_100551 [Planktothrix rubescens NIVA-CYA 18]
MNQVRILFFPRTETGFLNLILGKPQKLSQKPGFLYGLKLMLKRSRRAHDAAYCGVPCYKLFGKVCLKLNFY